MTYGCGFPRTIRSGSPLSLPTSSISRARAFRLLGFVILWILNTTILGNNDVLPLPQLREHSFLVTVGYSALKLKHSADRIEERLLLGRFQFPEPISDVLY